MREFGLAESTRCLDTSLDWTLVVGHNFDVKLPGAVAEESSCTPNIACAPSTAPGGPNAGALRRLPVAKKEPRVRVNRRQRASDATPGRAFAETPKGSRRRPPPPAGARPPAGLGQPSISEATGGQAAAPSLRAVPASVTAAHPKKGPAAAADVRAHFRPAYHGLRYRRS